jgi:hypothetical protein
MLEPAYFDQAVAQWRRDPLVLTGEIVLADCAADLFKHFGRLARKVRTSPSRRVKRRCPHPVSTMKVSSSSASRWEAHHLPLFLSQYVADQIGPCSR